MQPKKHYFAHIPTIAIFIVFAMSAPLGVLLILLALFAGQPIPKKKYIGMFVSLAGVALISIGTGFNGRDVKEAMKGHILASASTVGTYTLNPKLIKNS